MLLRKKVKYLYLFPLMILLGSLPDTEKKLQYEVVRNGKVIGQLEAFRKHNGVVTDYMMESNVKVSLLMDFSIYSKVFGSFNNGLLTSGSIIRRVNGKDKANSKITWNIDHYTILEKNEVITLKEKIFYTSACLMHEEPINMQRIFSENYKRFIPIKSIKPHQYELQLPDGNRNFYTYANGVCVNAEVNTTLSTVYFRLKN